MAVTNPPVFIQGGSHPAEDVRRMFAALTKDDEGVVAASDMAVAEKGTPDMSVDISAGRAWIKGTESTFQGTYFVESRAAENVAVTAADATNPRIDLVVAKVEDSVESGAVDAWSLVVVAGTPAGSPVAPAQPASSLLLATVAVAALASSIVDANITQSTSTLGTGTVTLAGDLSGSGVIDAATGDVTVSGVVADDSHAHTASTISGLDASDTTTGAFGAARIPDLDASKVATGTLADARIPSMAASKITSGEFSTARIPDLSGDTITSGTVAAARLAAHSGALITSGTVADARIASTIARDADVYGDSGGATGRKITASTSVASGGANGDIWLKY